MQLTALPAVQPQKGCSGSSKVPAVHGQINSKHWFLRASANKQTLHAAVIIFTGYSHMVSQKLCLEARICKKK